MFQCLSMNTRAMGLIFFWREAKKSLSVFQRAPTSLTASENRCPLSTPLTFQKRIANSVCQTLPTSVSTEQDTFAPGKCRSFSMQLMWEQFSPTAVHREQRQA